MLKERSEGRQHLKNIQSFMDSKMSVFFLGEKGSRNSLNQVMKYAFVKIDSIIMSIVYYQPRHIWNTFPS